MPISVSDFLRDVTGPLGIKDADLEAALQASGLKEIQLPDAVKTKFNENYLSPERAASDERVLVKARGAVYNIIEQRLVKQILPKLKEEDQKLVNDAPQLIDKINIIEKAMDNISGSSEDVKKIQEKWRETEKELRGQIKTFEENAKKADAAKKIEFDGIKLDYALRSKLALRKLAPEFEEHKEFLANSTIDRLKKNFVLQFDEKDQSIIHLRRDSDGQIVDVYEYNGEKRNTPFSLDEVIDIAYSKHTLKNQGGEDKSQQQQQQRQQTIVQQGKERDLRQMMLESAGV